MIQTPFSWFSPSCTTFSKLRECLVTSIKGTRGVIYWSEKAALTYSYFRGPTLSCIDIHVLFSSEAGKPSLNSSSTSLTMISWETSGCSLPKSIISYQKKRNSHQTAQFSPKPGTVSWLGGPMHLALLPPSWHWNLLYHYKHSLAWLPIFALSGCGLHGFLLGCCLIKFALW